MFVQQGGISNILEELVVQPLLVSISALTLATETVRSILKIDDVVRTPQSPKQLSVNVLLDLCLERIIIIQS